MPLFLPSVVGYPGRMPRILGIDSSLTGTGLARIDVSNNHTWDGRDHNMDVATVAAPGPTKDKSHLAMVRRVNALIEQIEDAVTSDGLGHDKPDLIAIENLAFGARGAGAWVLPWIFGRCCELAERYDIPLIVVATAARAKYATGKGNADKEVVLLAANNLFPAAQISNNNEGDAAVVGAIGCHYLGYPIVPETAYRLDVMEKIG